MLPKGVFIFFGRKIHFLFFECPTWVFLWRTYHIFVAKLDQIIFIKYYAIFNAQLTKWLGVKIFGPLLVKKTNSRWFSWKRVKFELRLPHSLLFIFYKNNFYVHKYLFNHRNKKKSKILPLAAVMPAVLTAFWNGHKKIKKNQKID